MNILNEISHRPYPLPSKKWIMRQTWSNLLFLHWPISPDTLRPYIPSHLQIDTFDGYAWLGVVAFSVAGIYPRGLSSLSLTPNFPEINVRTYVTCDGKPGIYFLSLDVDDWASYTIAKRWYHLPYSFARIRFQKEEQTFHFESIRKWTANSPIKFKGEFIPLPEVYYAQKRMLDHWFIERYCLFSSDKRGNIYCGDIHHCPWPLQKVMTNIKENTLFSPFHFDLTKIKPISHFSRGVDTLFWNIKKEYS
jgi:uncharacterized protein YqjF (DUF2071 family)